MNYLFTNLNDIKPFINVPHTLEIDDIQSALRNAGDDYIPQVISETVYESLIEGYNDTDNPLNETENNLLVKVQPSLIRFALHAYYLENNAEWMGSGFTTRTEGEGYSTADYRDVNRFLDNLRNEAFAHLEKLHLWIEKNRTAYPDYNTSEERTDNLRFFINTSIIFKKAFVGISAYTFSHLTSIIEDVEQFFILPSIGQIYFDALKTRLKSETTTADDLLPIFYIRKAIAPMVVKDAILSNLVNLEGANVALIQDKSSYKTKSTATNEQLSPMIQKLEETANRWLDKLTTTLKSNTEKYSDYNDYITTTGTDTEIESNNQKGSGFFHV